MIIQSSKIQMASYHKEVSLDIKSSTSSEGFTSQFGTSLPQEPKTSKQFNGLQPYSTFSVSTIPEYKPSESLQHFHRKLFQYILEQMRDLLEGNNFKAFSEGENFLSYDSSSTEQSIWHKKNTTYSFHGEYERTTFQTEGLVKTSDGRNISFNLSFSMSRSYIEETRLSSIVDTDVLIMKDPLVLNLDLPVRFIEDQHFLFDLDCDGQKEELPMLDSNSGFLALDKNGDGIINDGNELFGTKSGDGFKDLAQYDEDGNGWIDENDSVYSRLRIWTNCGTPNEQLLSLKDADVGAIFLGSLKTSMQLKNSNTNESLGTIQRTGIYLHESTGQAGSIQHVDFAI